jgi:chromosome segregation ATPase
MRNSRKAADGRSIGLVLAALAALGWGAAFYALSDNLEARGSAQQIIAELESENARLSALVDAKSRLDTVEAQIRLAREELVATLDRRRDLEQNIAALHTDLVALDGSPLPAVTGSMPDGDETQARASSLNAALVRLDRTIGERSSELAEINRSRLEAESRLGAASEAATEIDRRMSARTQELAAAEQRLSSLLADVARLDGLNERRAADLEKLGEGEARAREEVEAARAENEELLRRRSELAAEIEALEVSLAQSDAVRDEMEAEQARLAGLREDVAREDARLGQTKRQVSQLQGEIEAAQAELQRLRNAAQSAPRARPPVEDRPDGSRVIRVTPSFN